MTVSAERETHGFQTEVKQLLHLVVNALYSNKEIFLRELVSNASDAIDKLKFTALSDGSLYENDPELKIQIFYDKAGRTITVRDNGIGMTRDEVIENLGTIARSGTKHFLANLSEDQAKTSELIGQFGVGFYASFIVADKVEVRTRRAGQDADHGVLWISHGEGDYEIANVTKAERGTDVILHLKKDEDEFLNDYRLRTVIRKYSDHISIPIEMQKEIEENADDKTALEADQAEAGEQTNTTPKVAEQETWETVNRAKALWTQPKSDISEKDYEEFYKHISHDFEAPLLYSLNRVEGKLEYTSLMYIPAHAPFDLWNRDQPRGLKLYVKRVFIMDDAEQFLPMYLRFVKGIVDSNDLPLNISREILQSNHTIDKMRSALTKRVLSLLEKTAENDHNKYSKFWAAFGNVLKEGPIEDYSNREQIAKLLRFASTHADNDTQDVSFEDYIKRMQAGQDKIYYITGETYQAAKSSPHLEIFKEKGIEVLVLYDRVDEWLTTHLTEYQGKQLVSVARGDLDLGDLDDKEKEAEKKAQAQEFESIIKQMKEILKEDVKDIRLTHRLTNSPSCVVADEHDMTGHMQRILQAAGQDAPESKLILELNPNHALVKGLVVETDDERFSQWTRILLDQALLTEGATLSEPAQFVQRVNSFLVELQAK